MTTSFLHRAVIVLLLGALLSCAPAAMAGSSIDCSRATASVTELWPPNHKWVAVTIQGITGASGATTIEVTGVTQDEPLNGLGDGDTCPDAEITAAGVNLRAERSGTGNGRVYVISFTAADASGSRCRGTVQVCVPHDQRPGHSCVDDGQTVDSTGPCQ